MAARRYLSPFIIKEMAEQEVRREAVAVAFLGMAGQLKAVVAGSLEMVGQLKVVAVDYSAKGERGLVRVVEAVELTPMEALESAAEEVTIPMANRCCINVLSVRCQERGAKVLVSEEQAA